MMYVSNYGSVYVTCPLCHMPYRADQLTYHMSNAHTTAWRDLMHQARKRRLTTGGRYALVLVEQQS